MDIYIYQCPQMNVMLQILTSSSIGIRIYCLVWFCCFNNCDCCTGSWKKGNAPLPSANGICPSHLPIAFHCKYCGLCLNCSVISLIACDSPVAFATFALACA